MLHRPFLWLSLVILISNSFVLMTHQDPAWQQQPIHSTAGGSKDRPQPAFIKSHKLRPPRVQLSEKPNIVFIITDDQDSELGLFLSFHCLQCFEEMVEFSPSHVYLD